MRGANVESKTRATDLEAVARVVARLGARYEGRLDQVDTYFQVPQGRLKLREISHLDPDGRVSTSCELIRYDRPDEDGARVSRYERTDDRRPDGLQGTPRRRARPAWLRAKATRPLDSRLDESPSRSRSGPGRLRRARDRLRRRTPDRQTGSSTTGWRLRSASIRRQPSKARISTCSSAIDDGMPLQNRVTPLSELIADPARGLVYGNRGCLHDEARPHPPALQRQALDRLPARVPRLASKPAPPAGQLHGAVLPRRGDRVRCRPSTVRALSPRGLRPFRRALARAPPEAESVPTRSTSNSTASASTCEALRQRLHRAPLDELPEGAFVLRAREPWLVLGSELVRWTPAGYAERRRRPRGEDALLITPPSLVSILRADWQRGRAAAAPVGAALAPVAEPEAWPGTQAGHTIAGIGELAAVEGEAPAADALGQTGLEAAELCDSLVDPGLPAPGEARPVAASRCSVTRKPRELDADLLECEPHSLREDDERDPAQDRSRIASMAGARPLGVDEPPLLVEAQGRCGHSATTGDLANREQLRHLRRKAQPSA